MASKPIPFTRHSSLTPPPSLLGNLLGLILSACFSLVYLIAPPYIIGSLVYLIYCLITLTNPSFIVYPFVISVILPPIHAPNLVAKLTPLLTYFSYSEIRETSDEEMLDLMEKKNKKFILAATPHGVISFTGMCSAVYCIPQFRNINTAAASAVLQTPLLKHVMGIFGLIDANGKNLEKHFKKDGVKGSCVLYVGGIAELFKSSRKEERLYLQGRKGFIKMALKNGVDIIPLYLFGNTSVLTVMKNRTLEGLSRKLQASVTYFWGSYGLPIPRPNKILYVRGRPLGFPKIDNPTQEDIDKWHKVYVDEVVRIFETYRGELADYSKKEIFVE